jgi:hypothetical protein
MAMSTQHPTRTTDQADEVGLGPNVGDGDRPDAESPRSDPRHLAPSQRRPGLVRSLLAAALLVTVVLAVGAVVVLGSLDRLKHPPKEGAAGGSSGSAGSPGAAMVPTTTTRPLLRAGSFEGGVLGLVRAERGTRLELVVGGAAGSAHSARLSNSGPPTGSAGLLVDQVTRPPAAGCRYAARAVVKASRPGQVVQIQLVESVHGRRVSADPQMVRLDNTEWREISAQHEVSSNGSVLGVEVTFYGLDRGDFVWVDDLTVTQTL